MTREEILALMPGLDLDMAVTRILPGWSVFEDGELMHGEFRYRDHEGSTLYREHEWRPSESIADAWEVVEKMNDYDFTILKAGDHCEVSVGSMSPMVGNSVPELICKAALIAHIETQKT